MYLELKLWVKDSRCGRKALGCPGVVSEKGGEFGARGPLCSLDVLDVLLRHRLLRKPGGFEGLLGSRVEIRSSDQSLFDRVNEAVVHSTHESLPCGLPRW